MTPTENREAPERRGRVAVVGAGAIGKGVAHSFADAGYDVWSVTRRPQPHRMAEYFAHEVARGRLTEDDRLRLEGRISAVLLEDLPPVDLVVEAIVEDEAVKAELFRMLDERQPTDTVLATSTSTIPIARIASSTRHPERVIGMHYMTPVPVMELVEIIVGESTGEDALSNTEVFCRTTGKTPVVVRDHPGFVASRLAQALINEAAWILHHRVAGPEEIDEIARLGLNMPVGPLKLLDLVGADVAKRGLDSLHERLGDARYEVSPVIQRLVEDGTYGRKTGSGIYGYQQQSGAALGAAR